MYIYNIYYIIHIRYIYLFKSPENKAERKKYVRN